MHLGTTWDNTKPWMPGMGALVTKQLINTQSIRPTTYLGRITRTLGRTRRRQRRAIVNRVPAKALRAELHARILVPTTLARSRAPLNRVPGDIVRRREGSFERIISIASDALPYGDERV
jgi:hypothetical protein